MNSFNSFEGKNQRGNPRNRMNNVGNTHINWMKNPREQKEMFLKTRKITNLLEAAVES
jgi:hypothetical protein